MVVKVGKALFVGAVSCLSALVLAAVFAAAIPDHEVEISSVTGKCKKVEYQGQIIPNGCRLVKEGKIEKYQLVHGY